MLETGTVSRSVAYAQRRGKDATRNACTAFVRTPRGGRATEPRLQCLYVTRATRRLDWDKVPAIRLMSGRRINSPSNLLVPTLPSASAKALPPPILLSSASPPAFYPSRLLAIMIHVGHKFYWILPLFSGLTWLGGSSRNGCLNLGRAILTVPKGMLLGLLLWWIVDTGSTHLPSMAASQHIAYVVENTCTTKQRDSHINKIHLGYRRIYPQAFIHCRLLRHCGLP